MTFAGKRVLLTGDSHMDWSPFGSKLEELLRSSGATVVRRAIGGSSAKQWASGRQVCRTINGVKLCYAAEDLRLAGPFDLAIVSLGTNDAANASAANADRTRSAEKAADDVEKFMQLVGVQNFVVVGPPTLLDRIAHYTNANMTPLVDVFSRRFGSRYIDSRSVPHVDGDSVHMGRKGGAAWAQLVFDRVSSGSPELPTASSAGGSQGLADTASSDNTNLFIALGLSAIAVLILLKRKKKR